MPRHLAAVPDRPGRVVLYVRVSALMGRGGEDFHSPDVQISAMRRATTGMREIAVIDDIDVTGTHFSREGIDQIRAMAEARQIDAIAVYDISRFGRDVLESLLVLRELAQRGVTIISACEHIDTSTPAGEMMLINMLNLAQYRAREIGRGWSATIARRAERGQHHGRPPTGYRRRDDGRLEPDPILGPIMAGIFRDYAAGAQVRALRRRLQAATGNPKFAATTLKKMLANPTYRGIVHSRGPGGIVETSNAHEALVDETTWQTVQDRIAADRRIPARVLGAQYSLSGIGRCRLCEGNTNIRPHRNGPGIHCRGKYQATNDCTGCGNMRLADVERVVLDQVRTYIERLRGDVATQAAHLAKAARAGADVDALRRELDATRRAKARATQRWAREQIDDRTYDDTMADLNAAERQLVETLAQAQPAAAAPPPGQVVSLAEKLLELWPHMDGGQRNQLLREIVETVWVAPAEYYRQPADQRVEVAFR